MILQNCFYAFHRCDQTVTECIKFRVRFLKLGMRKDMIDGDLYTFAEWRCTDKVRNELFYFGVVEYDRACLIAQKSAGKVILRCLCKD